MTTRIISYALIAAGLVTGCSGGGGGSSPPPSPPTPPAPSNTAPSAVIDANLTSADEGQSISLSAANSTDPDGDTLNFTWSQAGGPTADITPNGDAANVRLPEVDQDTNITIRVTASDGSANDSADITLTSNNIILTPIEDVLGLPDATLTGVIAPQEAALAIPLTSGFGGPLALSVVTGSNNDARFSYFEPDSSGAFGPDAPFQLSQTIEDNLSSTTGNFTGGSPNVDYALGFEAEGSVQIFDLASGTPAYSELDQFDVPGVCSLASIGLSFADDLVIGTRGNGLSVFMNGFNGSGAAGEFDDEIILAGSGSYCLTKVQAGQTDIFSFNTDSSQIDRWEAIIGGFQQGPSIDPELPNGLTLVNFEIFLSNQGLVVVALLLTDGNHDGDHRVKLLYTDFFGDGPSASEPFFVLERTWSKGIPSDLEIVGVGDDASPDILVALETAPYVAVIENDASVLEGDTAPDFEDIAFSPTRLGATEISVTAITYRDPGIVEFQREIKRD